MSGLSPFSPTTADAPPPTPATTASPSTLESALTLAALGMRVLPIWWPVAFSSAEHAYGVCACHRGPTCGRDSGKHPITALVPHGKDNATSDEATIRRWLAEYPQANLAVALPDLRFFVVDVDARHDGLEKWARICAGHKPLPVTAYQRSGSGGAHGLFRRPPGIELRGKIMHGIDLPSSYFLVAPSLHACGGRYEWIRSPLDQEIAEPPEWLVELVRQGSRSRALPHVPSAAAELHARDDDPSVDAWNAAIALMRSGGTDAMVGDALRLMASYQRRLAERGEREAERWLDLTIGKARSSRAVVDPWPAAVRLTIVVAKYRHEPEKPWISKAELHRVRFQLAAEDGEVLEDRQYITLPIGQHEAARPIYEAVIGDLAAPDAWLDVGQRQRLEAALRGRWLDVLLPAGGRGRALRMRRAPP
ncbi:MAG: bifunctional DNA primase/polymerase [Polyangiaceae bacterium]